MKTVVNESKKSLFKKLGFLGIGLCALCCALPVIGTLVGVGVLSTLALYFEKIGFLTLIASALFFVIWYFKKFKAGDNKCITTCEISDNANSCGCKTGIINDDGKS